MSLYLLLVSVAGALMVVNTDFHVWVPWLHDANNVGVFFRVFPFEFPVKLHRPPKIIN